MEKACESLLQQPRLHAGERRVYEAMVAGLKQGQGIGASLGGASDVVTPLEVEVITAAEEGGMLEKGFGHLSEYFRRVGQTRSRIVKGMAYPFILLHVAIPACTIAVGAFGAVGSEGKITGSPIRSAFATAGQNMVIAYLVVAILVVISIILHNMARRSGGADAALNRIPLLGRARKAVAMERFSQVFEIFLLSGKKMSDSLAGAGKASGSGVLYEASLTGEKIVAGGDLLTFALLASPKAFPNDFVKGMTVAEEAGVLDEELAEWGRFYSDEARDAMEQLATWTPRLFYWGILILVAAMIVRAAMAYRDLIMNLLNFEF